MAKTRYRWGIIGCGDVTELKSGPAFQKTEGFTLEAVMRRDEGLAKDYARRHGVEQYCSDAELLIHNKHIDAVYVATPPDSHKMYGLLVAQAGKPCCIEKPLAPNLSDCQEIVGAFEQAGVPLFVAYYRRSLPRFLKVKSILDEGLVGRVRHISWQLSRPASDSDRSRKPNWRTDKKVARAGYFDDLASHGLDLFAYLLGDFERVSGLCLNQQGLYSAADAVTACWLHSTGVSGSGFWNFGTQSVQDQATIYGSQGEVRFSVFGEAPVTMSVEGRAQESFVIEHPENVQLPHVQNMREQLLNGTLHPSTGASALHTAWVMEQILSEDP